MQSLRIVQVVKGFLPSDKAGVPQHVARLARALVKRGHECQIVCGDATRHARDLELPGVRVFRRNFPVPRVLRRVPRLYRGIDLMLFRAHCRRNLRRYLEKKPDLIHGHGWLFGGMQAREMARQLDVPLVITLHGWSLDRLNGSSRPDYWPELSKADAILCQKSTAAAKLEGWGFPKDRIFRCLGPVEVPLEHEVGNNFECQGRPTVCLVGRMEAMKRPQLLLEALPLIRQRIPNVLAQFAGDGPMLPSLKALAVKLGVTDAVTFCGWVDDVKPMLRKASIFVASSPHHNSSDLSLLEAMAHGLPVIASESPGIRDVIAHEENGLVCKGEPESLASAIVTCLQLADVRRHLGEAGRAFVKITASIEAVVQLHEQIYATVCHSRIGAGETVPAETVR